MTEEKDGLVEVELEINDHHVTQNSHDHIPSDSESQTRKELNNKTQPFTNMAGKYRFN